MTSQEVRALIDAKIKGQGTNVDAGSVLPIILNGMLDLINEGGGGTSNAVQYIPQELAAPQQMQARKNQGLYYEGTSVEENDITLSMLSNSPKSYTWKGVSFYFQWDNSNQTPYPAPRTIADVLSFGWKASGQTTEMDVVVGENAALVAEGVYVLYGPDADPEIGPSSGVENYQYCIVAFEGNEESLDAGFYYPSYNEWSPSKYIDSVKYLGETTTIHQIPEKFLPEIGTSDAVQYIPQEMTESEQMQARKNQGLYYEEEGVKTIDYSLSGDLEGYYRKVSDEVIEASSVIGHKFTSYSETEYTITEDMVIAADDTHPTRILYDASASDDWAILIFPEDMEFEGDSFSKGVWFNDTGTFVNPNHIESLEYEGVTVHQIPEKYLPNTSGEQEIYLEVNNSPYYGSPYVELSGSQYDEHNFPIHAPFDISAVTVKYAKTKGTWTAPASIITADFSSDSWELIVEVGATSEEVEVFLEITSNDGHYYGKIITLNITNQD